MLPEESVSASRGFWGGCHIPMELQGPWKKDGSPLALVSGCSWGPAIAGAVWLGWGIADSCSFSLAPEGKQDSFPFCPVLGAGATEVSRALGTGWDHNAPPPVPSQPLTSGCISCRELKKGTKGGRPKWVMERSPVNRLLFSTFWKCRSQMY